MIPIFRSMIQNYINNLYKNILMQKITNLIFY